MATKPTLLPRWADTIGPIASPPSGQLDTGWTFGQKPPAIYFNWFQNLVYKWTQYLDAPTGSGTTPGMTVTAGTGVESIALKAVAGDNNSIPLVATAGGVSAPSLSGFLSGFPGAGACLLTGLTGLPAVIAANVAVGPALWGTTTNPGSTGVFGTGVTGASGAMFAGNGVNVNTIVASAMGAGMAATSSAVAGIYGIGVGVGGSAVPGVVGVGGNATALGGGAGVIGQGGDGFIGGGTGVSGIGGNQTGGGVAGPGVSGIGGPGAAGVSGTGGTDGGIGVQGTGTTNQAGVQGNGGPTSGPGVVGNGGASNGNGVEGYGLGTGIGVRAQNIASGYALSVHPDTTSPVKAAIHIDPQNAQPTGPHVLGDHYVDSLGSLWACVAAGTPGTWARVGPRGTATNDNAQAGCVGEYVEAIAGDATIGSWVTNTPKNIVSMSLTAGDWDVSAVGMFGGGSVTGSNTLLSISTVSATVAANLAELPLTPSATGNVRMHHSPIRLSLSATTTVYLVGRMIFTGGTPSAGGLLRARRVR